MQITFSPDPYPDEFRVHTNPGSNNDPFGIIDLGGGLRLNILTDEDADRLIRAAERVKAMLAALGTPHVFTDGAGPRGSHCTVCGDLSDKDHPVPEGQPS
jgi:hypothetical protein